MRMKICVGGIFVIQRSINVFSFARNLPGGSSEIPRGILGNTPRVDVQIPRGLFNT